MVVRSAVAKLSSPIVLTMLRMLERSGSSVDTVDTVFCASGAALTDVMANPRDRTTRTIVTDKVLIVIIFLRYLAALNIGNKIIAPATIFSRLDILGFRYIPISKKQEQD